MIDWISLSPCHLEEIFIFFYNICLFHHVNYWNLRQDVSSVDFFFLISFSYQKCLSNELFFPTYLWWWCIFSFFTGEMRQLRVFDWTQEVFSNFLIKCETASTDPEIFQYCLVTFFFSFIISFPTSLSFNFSFYRDFSFHLRKRLWFFLFCVFL